MSMFSVPFRSCLSAIAIQAPIRAQRVAAVVLAGLLLCALVPLAPAQTAEPDFDALRAQGEQEGWTYTVGPTSVIGKPLSQLCGRGGPLPDVGHRPTLQFNETRDALPSAFDWREKSGCTPIRNQGDCGSCWAFAAIGAMESHLLIHHKGLHTDLSEQWLVSCNPFGGSCEGGWEFAALEMLTCGGYFTDPWGDTGAILEGAFPYTGLDSACGGPYIHPYCLQEGWKFIGSDEGIPPINQIKRAIVNYGPVTAGVYVGWQWYFYTGGVFNSDTQPTPYNGHAVVLVGWNDADGGYWIMRNSWGTDWGEQGYMRIRYGCCRIGDRAVALPYNDCNGNGVPDKIDIADCPAGEVCDCDEDGRLDSCQLDEGETLEPTITKQPVPVKVCAEEAASFSVESTFVGVKPPKYQWRRDGVDIAGATATTYAIDVVGPEHEGAYDVVVTTNCGTVTSDPVALEIELCGPPAVSLAGPSKNGKNVPVTTPLQWSYCKRATTYEVYCNTEWDWETPQLVGQTTALEMAVPLEHATKYYWRVIARNDVGSTYSDVWSFKTVAAPPPSPSLPEEPSPANGATAIPTTVALGWQGGEPATNYQVLMGTKPTTLALQGSSTEPGIAAAGLVAGTTYHWRVVAINEDQRTEGPVWAFKTAGTAPVDPNEVDPNEAEPNDPNVTPVDPDDPNDPNDPNDMDPNEVDDPNQVQRVLSDVCPTTAATLVSLTLAGFFATRPRSRRLPR